MKDLKFNRQYFLSNKKISFPTLPDWKCTTLPNNTYLFSHPNLPVVTVDNGSFFICCIGYCYVSSGEILDNKESFKKIIGRSKTKDELTQSFEMACGRYAILSVNEAEFFTFTDAISLRNLYYINDHASPVLLASDLNLLKYLVPKDLKQVSTDPANLFFNNEFKTIGHGNAWIGPKTLFSNVHKLLPNKCLDLNTLQVSRYWPHQKIEEQDLDHVAEKLAKMIRSILLNAKERQRLSIAITAGYDSRLMVAASTPFKNEVHYFIDHFPSMRMDCADIKIGALIASKIDCKFHINGIGQHKATKEFKSIYLDNTFYAGTAREDVVSFYHQNHADYLNICGVGEVGRAYYGPNKFKMTGSRLAFKFAGIKSGFVADEFDLWLSECIDSCTKNNISPLTLSYWENRLGNWGSVGNCESDIAIEEFNPFNSHCIFQLMMSVSYRQSKSVDNKLFELIIKKLCPELDGIPVNPVSEPKKKIIKKIKNSILFPYVEYFRFKIKK